MNNTIDEIDGLAVGAGMGNEPAWFELWGKFEHAVIAWFRQVREVLGEEEATSISHVAFAAAVAAYVPGPQASFASLFRAHAEWESARELRVFYGFDLTEDGELDDEADPAWSSRQDFPPSHLLVRDVALPALDPDERIVVGMAYGFEDGPFSDAEIAERITSTTPGYIRRMRLGALVNMRRALGLDDDGA